MEQKMKKYFFSLCTVLFLILRINLQSQNSFWENISNQIPGDSLNNLSDVIVIDRWWVLFRLRQAPKFTGVISGWNLGSTTNPSPVNAFCFQYYDLGFIGGAIVTSIKQLMQVKAGITSVLLLKK